MEVLSAGRVDIWLVAPAAVPEPSWPRYIATLDHDERERAHRFVFEADRRLFIAAHVLLRSVLSRYLPRSPEQWRFVTCSHGKPALARDGDPALTPDGEGAISFNISHTAGLAACAITAGAPIGVDVERIDGAALTLEFARAAFAAPETACVEALPTAQQPQALAELWTLKEAVAKAVGLGLSLPLQSFFIAFDPPAVTFADAAFGRSCEWQLSVHRPTSDHTLAIAVRTSPGRRLRVALRTWLPPVA
jgi:4'-phosphopantetheinyl transferase